MLNLQHCWKWFSLIHPLHLCKSSLVFCKSTILHFDATCRTGWSKGDSPAFYKPKHDRRTNPRHSNHTHIWKAWNDLRFQNKNWTVWQLHNAVAADITSTSLSIGGHEEQVQSRIQQDDESFDQHNLLNAGVRPPIAASSNHATGNQDLPTPALPSPPLYTYCCQAHGATPAGAAARHTVLHRCINGARFAVTGFQICRSWSIHHKLSTKAFFCHLHQSSAK